jgi:hypothetical protein
MTLGKFITTRTVAIFGSLLPWLSATLLLVAVSASASVAATITSVTEWGTLNPTCTTEGSSCSVDPAFNPSTGGYRAGGSVSWGDPANPLNQFVFDTSAFSSITSIALEVLVVGFYTEYQGNIDPSAGQTGNYLAINGTPIAPFLGMTDGRDTRTFDLTTILADGLYTFSVVAYTEGPSGNKHEGWAGVDFARLTVIGESSVSAVPVPAALPLLASGMGALGMIGWRRKRRAAAEEHTLQV